MDFFFLNDLDLYRCILVHVYIFVVECVFAHLNVWPVSSSTVTQSP